MGGLAIRRGSVALLLSGLSLLASAVEANQASLADLETVRGIGPGLSGRILAERQKAAFKDWPDFIARVGGVGPGSAARLSGAGLTINGATYEGPLTSAARKASRQD